MWDGYIRYLTRSHKLYLSSCKKLRLNDELFFKKKSGFKKKTVVLPTLNPFQISFSTFHCSFHLHLHFPKNSSFSFCTVFLFFFKKENLYHLSSSCLLSRMYPRYYLILPLVSRFWKSIYFVIIVTKIDHIKYL